MGSPAFAVPSLRLLAEKFNVTAVFTQPPRPAGRGQELQKTPVHQLAEELGLTVFHPEKLKGEALEHVLSLPCDAIAVVAYGLLLPKTLVDSRTCINLHPSALPRWRGAAPLQHTLLAGDAQTEICIMKLDVGMDTGPVYSRTPLPVPPDMTMGQLHDLCAERGAGQLAEVLQNLKSLAPQPQPENGVTLAPKITPEMRRIGWSLPAGTLHNLIRALTPQPGAVASLLGEDVKVQGSRVVEGSGKPGAILALNEHGITFACGQKALLVAHLQRPGKKMLPVAEVARGWAELQAASLAGTPGQS